MPRIKIARSLVEYNQSFELVNVKNIVIGVAFVKVLVPYLPFTKLASLVISSQSSFFLFLFLKYLSCLLNTSHNF